MSNYIGAECPVCKKQFVEVDDVVVCPICGTPHHRTCYQQNGSCAFEQQHTAGHVWKDPNAKKESEDNREGTIICKSCHAKNPENGIFCCSCGAALKQEPSGNTAPSPWNTSAANASMQNAYTMACGGMSPAEEIDGICARDFAYFVGSSSRYYLPRFQQISKGNSLSINFSAFICNFFFFFYRKMYVPGMIFLALTALIYLPNLLIMPQWAAYTAEHLPELLAGVIPAEPLVLTQFEWVAAVLPYQQFAFLGLSLACALFGNQLYYRHVLHQIQKIKAEDSGLNEMSYTNKLIQKGNTNFLIVILLGLGLFLLYFGLAWLSLLPYWDEIYSVVAGSVGMV